MTLEENKKIVLALIEEYSPQNPYLTDDEDIATRLNLVYAPNYQEISQIKKIIKTKVLREITGNTEEGFEELSLPANMYQLKRVVALNNKNQEVAGNWNVIGKKIYVDKSVDVKYILEYYMYPSVITENTPNSFMLEIDQDAQMPLAYLVANDILKADPSSNHTAFLTEFKRKIENLDPRRELPSIVVEEGVL